MINRNYKIFFSYHRSRLSPSEQELVFPLMDALDASKVAGADGFLSVVGSLSTASTASGFA